MYVFSFGVYVLLYIFCFLLKPHVISIFFYTEKVLYFCILDNLFLNLNHVSCYNYWFRKLVRLKLHEKQQHYLYFCLTNRGSTIAKIVGNNVLNNSKFEKQINMYVYEEIINGRKLTEIINEDHENVKYLPGHKLPVNVVRENKKKMNLYFGKFNYKKFRYFFKVAIPDVLEASKDADILIFVLPHQFMKNVCKPLIGKVKPSAFGVSLCKGFYVKEDGEVQLISTMVKELLSIDCAVVMGANIANEVAAENFCEATIGKSNKKSKFIAFDFLFSVF
jgi:glycerol-3-phosphate dehydrogenase (NAD+)